MQNRDLDWVGQDVPVSRRFDDPYYSIEDGLAESRYVFLDGNGLPGRFRDGFRIAELGFGTGLNALVAWEAWDAAGHRGPLRFTSFEAYPLSADDMARALLPFEPVREKAEALCKAWTGHGGRFALGSLELEVIEGLAEETLTDWKAAADAWFLDGFAPAKNPDLWSPALLAEVAAHGAAGSTLATYSAAGHVRRALEAAGYTVERKPGFRGKRHMSVGRL